MKKIKLCLFLVFLCLLYGQGTGLAETMYVTDRLYLSLRNAPDPEQRPLALLPSDMKVDVLETEGDWAKVMLEDGRTGWVMKKYLVKKLHKSSIIEQLEEQIHVKNNLLKRLQEENVSLEKQIEPLKKEIEILKNGIIQHKKRIEMTTKENTQKRLKEIFATGVLALFVGLIIGYLLKRTKRTRLY
ncbi:MAG: TIGR04211 family SH3 domain-containing protein [Deltaproteobacteria bacterium]|nr:MAG: TIGR04211 family SH3 domain-containing protein [Deltaproteobacteria bacterium]